MDSTFLNLQSSGQGREGREGREGQIASSLSRSSICRRTIKAAPHLQFEPLMPSSPDPLTKGFNSETNPVSAAVSAAVQPPPISYKRKLNSENPSLLEPETPMRPRPDHTAKKSRLAKSTVESPVEGSGLAVPILEVSMATPAAEGLRRPSGIPCQILNSSPPINASLKRPVPFNQSQVSIALAFSKSRPEAASPTDYAQQLRNNAKIADNRNGLDGNRRYIDTGEHWKGLYEKLLDEHKALSDRVHRERQLRVSQNQDDSTDNNFPEGWNEEVTFMSANDQHRLRMSSYVVRLGRERSDLDKLNELLSDPNHIENASKQVIRFLALLENALLDCCPPLGLYQPKTPWQDSRSFTNLRQVTYQVKLGFLACFTTLNSICGTIPGRKLKKGIVIYGMVSFMTKAIKLLHTLCKKQTEHRKLREYLGNEQEVYAVNKCLTCTIVSIILSLDWEVGKPGHAELLEGILFTILEHTGSLLSVAIFGEDMPAKKKRDRKDKGRRSTTDTTNAESLYVVQILYASLGGAQKQKLVSRVLMGGDGAELIQKAKRFIQGTLLKSTYGKEHLESLRRPALPAEEVELQEVEHDGELSGHDWLINMATSIVGWDLVLPE